MVILITAITAVGLVALVGCGPLSQAQQEPQLEFEVAMQVNSDQEFHISLGIHNAGAGTFGGDNSFNGEMEIRRLPSDELRASAQIVPLRSLAPDEIAWPLDWHGQLEAGSYELTWGAEGYGSTTETFAIVERDGRLYFEGAHPGASEPEASSDEEPDALVARAISDLQRRLQVEAEAIEVVGVEPTEFPDASLGVPEPGQAYAQVIVPGVIIRLEAQGEVYVYHGAGERVVLVPEDGERETSGQPSSVYENVDVPEIGMTFEVPPAWERLAGELAWASEEEGSSRVGCEWLTLEPPMELEAALLPKPAQIVASTPIDLGWAEGRRFTLEVYGPSDQGDDTQAPVESMETHVLFAVDQGGGRLGVDFYASAPDAEALEALEPALQHMLSTARLREDLESVAPASEVQTDNWEVFEDKTYGFRLRIPQDWTYKEMQTDGPGVPEDWPLERSVAFFPQAWAERFEQSGPPDPNAPPTFPALSVEVYAGSMEQFRRANMEPTTSEELVINGNEVIREIEVIDDEHQIIRSVFQHPDREDVRIVLLDVLTGFRDRLEENNEVAALIPHIVATLEFDG
jgi:hypothetical protein